MSTVTEIAPKKHRAARVRRIFGRCLRTHIERHGEDIAGFAIVSWDMLGHAHSSYSTEVGPVSPSLMPAYTHDALNRLYAVVLAEESTPDRIDGA